MKNMNRMWRIVLLLLYTINYYYYGAYAYYMDQYSYVRYVCVCVKIRDW